MDFFKKIYPRSFEKSTVLNDFIVTLVIYVVLSAVVGIVNGVLGTILPLPFAGAILGSVTSLVGLYCTGGIVFSILTFTKVIK